MLSERVKRCFFDYDYNCAEAMLCAANDEYNMGLDKEAFKTMSAFGGGMNIEEYCGAMTGGLAVLGMLFVKERAHESTKISNLSKEFIGKVRERLETDNCKKLRELYKEDELLRECEYTMVTAAQILEDIVLRELKG